MIDLVEEAASFLRPFIACGYTDAVGRIFEASSPEELARCIVKLAELAGSARGRCLCRAPGRGCVEVSVPSRRLLQRLIALAGRQPAALLIALGFAVQRLAEEQGRGAPAARIPSCRCPVQAVPVIIPSTSR